MPTKQGNETRQAATFFIGEIKRLITRPVRLMEVCGTHTVAIYKAGIRQLLPSAVELVSGPGCPVCVTPTSYIDTAIAYCRQQAVIITTFGDMLRVPGSSSSLGAEKACGADIRVIYSPLESLNIAADNPTKIVIFLAVGFETTAPLSAAAVLSAEAAGLENFCVLSAHKLVPPALRALVTGNSARVDGFLLPGHVCAITGGEPFRFLAEEFNMPAVIAGFQPLDILQAVYMLAKQLNAVKASVENQYSRVVKPAGNQHAREVLGRVYGEMDAPWRGMGVISRSGLRVAPRYAMFDAASRLPVKVEETQELPDCRCGEVLCGLVKPTQCLLFGKRCVPEHPIGACMVSVEGTCAAWYKYGAGRWQ